MPTSAATRGAWSRSSCCRACANTDARVLADKPVTPTFLFALLLYGPDCRASSRRRPPERWHELATILDACDQAMREAQTRIAIPKRFSLGVREMFALQPRLEHPRGRRALRVLEHPRFRAAYDLLLLRAQFGLAPPEMAQWWTRLQEVSPEERGRMADALAGERPARGPRAPRRRRRRRRRVARRAPPDRSRGRDLAARLYRSGQQPRGSAQAGAHGLRAPRRACRAPAVVLTSRLYALAPVRPGTRSRTSSTRSRAC